MCVCVCVCTELQQVCSCQIAVSQTEAPAVGFLPQPLQESAHSPPADVSLAVCCSCNTDTHVCDVMRQRLSGSLCCYSFLQLNTFPCSCASLITFINMLTVTFFQVCLKNFRL